MVTELVGHHVVNARPAKPGRVHLFPPHILRILPRACPHLQEIFSLQAAMILSR
jgi:hypothetical protein